MNKNIRLLRSAKNERRGTFRQLSNFVAQNQSRPFKNQQKTKFRLAHIPKL